MSSMAVAADADVARKMPACFALQSVQSPEVRVAGNTKGKEFRASCLTAFVLLGDGRSLLPAMVAGAKHNARFLEFRACAGLAKTGSIKLLELPARNASLKALQLLCFMRRRKKGFEVSLAVAVITRLSGHITSLPLANVALRCTGAGKSKHLK